MVVAAAVVGAAARVHPLQRPAISTPRLRVDPFSTEGAAGSWTVRWRVTNESDGPILLLAAQHPHSQFRTLETRIDREIAPRASADLTLPVRFSESPGGAVENPFLILRFRQNGDWRVLARVRVTAGRNGEPLAGDSVVLTTQKLGAAD